MQRIFYESKLEAGDGKPFEEWAERHFGISLPDDFLFFVQTNGIGADPIPCQSDGKIGMDRMKIEEFYGCFPPEDQQSIQSQTAKAAANDRISHDILIFAYGGGGHLKFTLAVNGPHRGKVFAFVDSGVYLEGDQIRLKNGALHLADTFSGFIDGLYADADYIDDWEDAAGYLPDEIKEKFGSGL
ncbi:SMI1/KNR4 family protein [Microbulbifer sp. 2304DJ12-6]